MRKCKEVNCSRFGDEFRPVRLDLHVIGYDSTDNPKDAFKFDNNLNYRWVITIEYFLSSRILNALSGSSMSSRDTIQKRNQLLSFAVQGRGPHKQVWAVMTNLFLQLTFFFLKQKFSANKPRRHTNHFCVIRSIGLYCRKFPVNYKRQH